MMCKNYDLYSFNPIEPTTIFKPSDKLAICLMIISMKKNDTIEWQWYYRNDSSKAWVICPLPFEKRHYTAIFNGTQAIAGYFNITGCWPGLNYPRAYKVEVYQLNDPPLFSEFFEVTNGGLNSPRICEDIDADGYPVNMKSRFTIGNDTKAYHYLKFDKIAYFNEQLGFCHNFTTVWIQPNGSIYKTYSGNFTDYKDVNANWNYWQYKLISNDYISINSSTLVGSWKVEVYLDSYFNNTWMRYGPIATTPFIVGSASEPVGDWTFMVYLDGDNTLENASIDVFLKMAKVGSLSGHVKIVVQMDRIPDQDDRYGNWTDCKRFYVIKGQTPTPGNATLNLGEVNMSDPNTLKDFISWTMEYYPANHYALVLWDHGAGCMGVCEDLTDNDFLSLPEVSLALSGLPAIIDLVLMDACSMNMAEVAYQIKDNANLLVGPEGIGYAPAPYDDYLSNLTSNSLMLPSVFATDIVIDYICWCNSIPPIQIQNATMTATDLTKIPSFTESIDDFALKLKKKEAFYYKQISQARNQTQEHQGPYADETDNYIDLYHFAQLIYQGIMDNELRNAANQMMTTLSIGNTILIEANKALPNSHGLSIYFPNEKDKYQTYESVYKNTDFAQDTLWNEFIKYHLELQTSKCVLTIQTNPQYKGILVKFDEEPYTTNATGELQFFVLPDSYNVSAPSLVSTGSGSRGIFTQWSDNNASNPRTLSVNGKLTLVAEYETQHRLILDTKLGRTDPSVGEHWYKTGLHIPINATAPNVASDEERYSWHGWITTDPSNYNITSNSASILMDKPINVTAIWKHEYKLTVTSTYGSPQPTSQWFEAGKSINASVTSPVSGPTGTRYVCTGWSGTGNVPTTETNTFITFTIDKPSKIIWNWKTQYTLTIRTDPAGLSPQPNVSLSGPWYDNGTLLNCTAPKVSGYLFDHWTSDDISWEVGVNPIPVTIDGSHEITAHYVKESTWWDILTNPQTQQVILGLLGTVVSLAVVGGAWVKSRRKRGIIKTFLNEIDDIYSKLKNNPKKCEEELYRIRNTILEGLTEGKITEESYNILDAKLDKYMKELQKQKTPENADK
jgi:hypothetical protein